jgi:predicted nucleotidyltransferase
MPNSIEGLKKTIGPILNKYGISRAAFFGSVARNEATMDSDIDLIVEFRPGSSLLDMARLKSELESRLMRKVDIVTYRSLHPRLRNRILREQVIIR